LPFMSTIAVCRLRGAEGENCQCSTAWPGATAHRPICATRNVPPQPYWQVSRAPCACASEPASTVIPLKNVHGSGPLHTRLCTTASKVFRSCHTLPLGTQLLAIDCTSAFCSTELVKVM